MLLVNNSCALRSALPGSSQNSLSARVCGKALEDVKSNHEQNLSTTGKNCYVSKEKRERAELVEHPLGVWM